MKFGVNLRRIRHELPGVLHMRVGEQGVVGSLLVRAMRVVLGGQIGVICCAAQMRCGACMVSDGSMNGHKHLSLAGGRFERGCHSRGVVPGF